MLLTTPERERAYITMCARDMHPDLFEGVPQSEAEQEMRRRYSFADQLDDLRRVYLEMEALDLPYSVGAAHVHVTVRDYSRPELKERDWIDIKETRRVLSRAARALMRLGASIEKKYDETAFEVEATFPSGLKFRCRADRAAVCRKKVVGREWVEPVGGRWRDVVQWDCEPVSLLRGE